MPLCRKKVEICSIFLFEEKWVRKCLVLSYACIGIGQKRWMVNNVSDGRGRIKTLIFVVTNINCNTRVAYLYIVLKKYLWGLN